MATGNPRIKTEKSRETLGLENGAENPSASVVVTHYPRPGVIQRKKTVKRSEVMEQGRELIQKLNDRQARNEIAGEMHAWLDEHKVKVLPGQVKDQLFVWGLQHGSEIKVWAHSAPDDLEEYTYTYEEEGEAAPQSMLVRRDILGKPLQEIRLVAADLDEARQRRLMRPVRRLENGIDWLDWHERERRAEREAVAEEQKKVRGAFAEAAAKLTTSCGGVEAYGSKLESLLLKADRVLSAVAAKDDGPCKKRRVETPLAKQGDKTEETSVKQEHGKQPAGKPGQVTQDVQVLVDTLTFRLPLNRAVFEQLKKVLKHLDGDVVSGIDYDRERCIARRTERINAVLGSEDETN
ncbi:hypothetical protein AK830_g12670 [Neonectria ditissima]|uniref:Uncharacterized protein n=1 Tax=Neonectria ditissima TaxID=78410 RepID=A0A0P7AAE2_9HYPO|nr:hypothetical protein AK830_g12670 [Neonectria ditissima]